MNDKEILTDILSTEKCISNNFGYMINEMSNDNLYEVVYELLDLTKQSARDIFNLMSNEGMYSMENVKEENIIKTNKKLNTEYKKISKS